MQPIYSTLIVIALALLATPAFAKPGKGKGNSGNSGNSGKGGPPAHSGKGNSGHPGKGKSGPPGHAGKDKDKGKAEHPGNGQGKVNKFDNDELDTLFGLFAPDNHKNLPPGLRKNLERGKPLPPGWQKKVAAGQVIDAGWLDLMTHVPYDDLPGIRQRPGTRLYYHDNRLIRVNPETRLILEVINFLTR